MPYQLLYCAWTVEGLATLRIWDASTFTSKSDFPLPKIYPLPPSSSTNDISLTNVISLKVRTDTYNANYFMVHEQLKELSSLQHSEYESPSVPSPLYPTSSFHLPMILSLTDTNLLQRTNCLHNQESLMVSSSNKSQVHGVTCV